MITLSELPAVNATLNATSAVFLALGYGCIRRKRVAAHRTCMLIAVVGLGIISDFVSHLSLACGTTSISQDKDWQDPSTSPSC